MVFYAGRVLTSELGLVERIVWMAHDPKNRQEARRVNDRTRTTIERLLNEGENLGSDIDARRWETRVAEFLDMVLGNDAAGAFRLLGNGVNRWDDLALQLGHLEGLLAKDGGAVGAALESAIIKTAREMNEMNSIGGNGVNTREVFLVHGHDGEAKEAVARFLEKLGLKAVILHEQPNEGRTIIEKFEVSSVGVAFAVVILTPDDVGAAKSQPDGLRDRARQNVILELGYFMGRLGRAKVCALYKGDVELPSDYQGIIYTKLDDAGGWKAKLAQELVEAKLPINLQGLIAK
jgi:predicted nucleotide-binding protein